MTNVLLLLAAVVFGVGVCIGSVLPNPALDRRHRRVTQLVRELHDLEEALADDEEALARSSHLRATYQDYPRQASGVDLRR